MLWEGINYSSEKFLPNGTPKPIPDNVAFNRDLFDHYKKLIHIRNTTPALQSGDFHSLLTDDENQIYVSQRYYRKQNVLVVLNNSRDRQHIQLDFVDANHFEDVLNERSMDVSDEKLRITLEPKWASILVNEKMSP
ncbi:DUF3459 domain-containing protein [candidate division KSB1 bacterium]|nr:DUF3459 domain-containing protein [candidate division KSB1 bacterium]NIR69424.1 DUF3459 domain-containing protein [candidate division KSB1 bacterium]NIS22778.1 DUF3459 domain-containing protein [candidate division KSB1 bacterium]NIT69618.1 DUF3459 domain-containing protein [candidate division KSB1 bacterium]NIU23287.1 DUF3459 domain-containing protein [candidate division KSB1 bacterium]